MAVSWGVSIGVCRARFTKVDEAGNVVAGLNSYVTADIQQVTFNANKETGESIIVRNGCGCGVASKKFPDTFNWWDLTLNMVKFEPALENLLLGGGAIENGSDEVGVAFPGALDCNDAQITVAIEWWTMNQVGSGQDGTYPWIHYVIPSVHSSI